MFCPECGVKLPDGARACPACGMQLPVYAYNPSGGVALEPLASVNVTRPAPTSERGVRRTIKSRAGKRSEVFFATRGGTDAAIKTAEQILDQSGYKKRDYNGEVVWKKGTGAAQAMQYVRLDAYDDCLGVQGWVQIGAGDIGLNEMCLEGFVAVLPKKSLLKLIRRIETEI